MVGISPPEPELGLNFSRALRTGVAAMVLRGGTMLSRLLLALVMARMLPPTDMGTFGLAITVLSVGAVLVGLELYTQGNRDMVPLQRLGRAVVIRDQFALYPVTYLLAAAAMAVAVRLGFLSGNIAVVLLVLLVLDHISQELFRVLIYMSRTVWANVVFFLRAGVWAFAVAASFVLLPGTRSLWSVFAVWAVGAALASLCALYALRDLPWSNALRTRISVHWMRRSLIAALPFLVSASAALASIYGDRVFIELFVGRDQVGVYTLFSGFALAIPALVTAMVTHQFLPLMVRAMTNERAPAVAMLRRFAAANAALTLVGVACSLMLIYPALWIIDRPEYRDNVGLFFWLVPAMALRAVAEVPAAALYGVRADRRLLATNLLAVGTALIGNALLVPVFGVFGAAYAAIAASVMLLASQIGFGYEAFQLRFARRVVPTGSD